MIAPKEGVHYQLRFPPGLRERIRERADANGRSINTEIIEAIEQYLERGDSLAVRVAAIERRLGITVGGPHQ